MDKHNGKLNIIVTGFCLRKALVNFHSEIHLDPCVDTTVILPTSMFDDGHFYFS